MEAPDKKDVAVWRYGIISSLLHRNEEDGTLENALMQLASHTFRKLDGSFATFSPETLRKWLYHYRNGGLPALENAERKNKGTHASVPERIEKRLFELRDQHPRWLFSR